ncbi:Lipopolysaccharide biosynthesis protein RffA [Clostridiaceae bacterium JG1575]|nr:Lipopolysaccharide biosynthesis protein RffA [Clostridiaceae bacterium JG1575]
MQKINSVIPFNKPWITDLEEAYVLDALKSSRLSGDGPYTHKVEEAFRRRFGIERFLLTSSGTDALELAFLVAKIEPGDEVITPSFTFSSTVNAFMLRGAVPVFCDIRPDTMNLDEKKIEALITPKTKAIVTVDYAGIPCDMDPILTLADAHQLLVIEDAAQSVGSTYKGRPCGLLGHMGCYSFHETKNFCMGEGGAAIFTTQEDLREAEMIREKGTNRKEVLKGLVDKYTWHRVGSSFLPSDLLAALLAAQLERYEEIFDRRMAVWQTYYDGLAQAQEQRWLKRPVVPAYCTHNAHMFNIQLPTPKDRDELMSKLKERGISTYICYVPLHSAPLGLNLGESSCPVTEDLGARTLRLPLYAQMEPADALRIVHEITDILGRR